MIPIRVVVNLLSFVLLAAVLTWWALANHVTFGLTSPDRHQVVMEFAASPGLQPGFVVAYRGHPVGRIDRVELERDRVRVVTAIDPEAPVPADVRASVRRASAVGEPYVDLAPDGATTPGALLADGDVVPLERTSVPRSYEEVFRAVVDVLDSVPVEDIGGIVDELSVALDGREDELAALVADTEDVLDTLAARSDTLDALAEESTRLAGLAADLAPGIGAALDDLGPLSASLHDAREEMIEVLDRAPGLAERVTALLRDSRGPLDCLLGSLDRSLGELDTPANRDRLLAAIEEAPALIDLLQASTHEGETGPWLRVDVIFNTGTPAEDPLVQFESPLPHPEAPTTGACMPVAHDAGGGQADEAARASLPPPVAVEPDDGRRPQAGRPDDRDVTAPSASSEPPRSGDGSDLPWLALAAGLLLLAGGASGWAALRRRGGGT